MYPELDNHLFGKRFLSSVTWSSNFFLNFSFVEFCICAARPQSLCKLCSSGVPKEPVLGLLLFLIMIQDIDEKIKHLILSSFADGIRMMKKILSIFDVVKLQQYLNEVYFWTEKNNAQLNGDKFEHVSFGKNKELTGQSNYSSNINPQAKESVKVLLCTKELK